MSGSARIELCGDLSLSVGGESRTAALPGRQGRLALAYLALHRTRAVSRDELIGALWGEEAGADRGPALSVLLSKLRRVAGAALETRGDRAVRLAEAVTVDLEEAEAALASAVAAADGGAWAEVPGPARAVVGAADRGLLGGLEASWLDAARRHLSEDGLRARELLAEAGPALGGAALAEAERAGEALVTAAPFRERGAVLLMRVLAAQGNGAEALRVFDRLRTVLRDELGVPPGPEAQAELEALLSRDTPAPPAPAAPPSPARAPARSAGVGTLDGEDGGGPARAIPPPPWFATRSDLAFVGRRAELAALAGPLAEAAAGHGRIALLAGEPGIGKTRLALQLMAQATAEGALGLYGRSDPESVVPYQPFVEALRRAATTAGAERVERWRDLHGPDLHGIVPELAPAGAPSPRAESDDGEASTERFRLFEAIAAIVLDLARTRTVVLVLDDLHWADRPTLQLVRHLMRAADSSRLLVVATYRDSERGPELGRTVASLRRDHVLADVGLAGLGEQDAVAFVEALAGSALPAWRALWEETRGNPFFLEEMVRHVTTPGPGERGRLPDGVREVVLQRLARLAPETGQMLTQAAVIGREIDVELLETIGPASEDVLDACIEEALAARVLAEAGDEYGRLSFTHALIRQTLYEELTATRRARLHLRVAEALEATGAPAREEALADLARHYALAPPARGAALAAGYAERAARHASRQLAHEEAARLYALALKCLDRAEGRADGGSESGAGRGESGVGGGGGGAARGGGGARAGGDERRCLLLLARGDAQAKAADAAGARETFQAARAVAGTPALLAAAALGHGVVAQMEGGVVDAPLVESLEEALDAVGTSDPALRARLLARLAMELSFSGVRDRRDAISEEAMALAREVGDPGGLGLALVARPWSLWGPGNLRERLAAADELLALAERTGDDRFALHGNRWRMMDVLELGDVAAVDTAIDHFEAAARRRNRIGDVLYVPMYRAMRLLLAGDLDAAERESRQAVRMAERIGGETNVLQAHVIQMAVLRRERGGLAELGETVAGLAQRFGTIPGWTTMLAWIHAHSGRGEEARALLDELGADGFASLPLDGLWLGAIALASEAAVACGAQEHVAVLYDELAPYADRNVPLGWVSACLGSAARTLGLLAGALGRHEDAVAHFDAALATNERMGAAALLARTQLEYAAALATAGTDPARAEALRTAALAAADTLGLPVLAAEADALVPAR